MVFTPEIIEALREQIRIQIQTTAANEDDDDLERVEFGVAQLMQKALVAQARANLPLMHQNIQALYNAFDEKNRHVLGMVIDSSSMDFYNLMHNLVEAKGSNSPLNSIKTIIAIRHAVETKLQYFSYSSAPIEQRFIDCALQKGNSELIDELIQAYPTFRIDKAFFTRVVGFRSNGYGDDLEQNVAIIQWLLALKNAQQEALLLPDTIQDTFRELLAILNKMGYSDTHYQSNITKAGILYEHIIDAIKPNCFSECSTLYPALMKELDSNPTRHRQTKRP